MQSQSSAHDAESLAEAIPSTAPSEEAEFYGDYLQQLKDITWRFEIALETYLMQRTENDERAPISSWKTRIKTPESMKAKLAGRGLPQTAEAAVYNVHDAAGARVICPLIDDVAAVAQFIRELPCFEVVEEKDYIHHPKPNGYRSYHMILAHVPDSRFDPEETRRKAAMAAARAGKPSVSQLIDVANAAHELAEQEFSSGDGKVAGGLPPAEAAHDQRRLTLEVQLRTIAQDSWASIEHELKYKQELANQEFLQAELKRCADEIASADLSLQTLADLVNEAKAQAATKAANVA